MKPIDYKGGKRLVLLEYRSKTNYRDKDGIVKAIVFSGPFGKHTIHGEITDDLIPEEPELCHVTEALDL